MDFIRALFGLAKPKLIEPAHDEVANRKPAHVLSATYPPPHDGIPVAGVDDLMTAQSELLARLKIHAALPEHLFEERFLVPIKALAEYISNIPGSKDGLYGGPGGLFRASMEMAFYSFQASDGRIFTGQLGVEARYELEKRWRYLCFLGGLMWPLGLPIEKIRVRASNGDPWNTRSESLTSWALRTQSDYYFVAWPKADVIPGPSISSASLSLTIAGNAGVRWLEGGTAEMITAYSQIGSGVRTDFNSIAYDLLEAKWKQLSQAEQSRLPQNYGRVQYGQHLAPRFIDAMRECIGIDKWVPNSKIVLADKTGVYLVWPRAAVDLLASDALKNVQGIPATPSGLLQSLIDERLLFTDAQDSAFVDVADANGELHLAVKLVKPEALIDDFNPNDYTGSVVASDVAINDPLVEQALQDKRMSKPSVAAVSEAKASDPMPQKVAASEESVAKADKPRVLAPPPPAALDPLSPTLGLDIAPAEVETDVAPAPSNVSGLPVTQPHATASTTGTDTVDSRPASNGLEPAKKENSPARASDAIEYGVPAEIEKVLGKVHSTMLRAVVKEMGKKSNESRWLCHKDFVGLPMDVLQDAISSYVDLLAALQKNGWLQPVLTKPRAMVHEMSLVPGGSNKAHFVLLTHSFVERAAIKTKCALA